MGNCLEIRDPRPCDFVGRRGRSRCCPRPSLTCDRFAATRPSCTGVEDIDGPTIHDNESDIPNASISSAPTDTGTVRHVELVHVGPIINV